MGLIDKLKDTNQRTRNRKAEQRKTRGDTLLALPADYIGGYEEYKKSTGMLSFYEHQIEYKVPLGGTSFTVPLADVKQMAIEGRDEVTRRVTVTRLLLVGIFAFALKKKDRDKESFVTIITKHDREIIFQINKKSPMDTKILLSKVTKNLNV